MKIQIDPKDFNLYFYEVFSTQMLLWQKINNDVIDAPKATTEGQSDIIFYDRQFRLFMVSVSFLVDSNKTNNYFLNSDEK